VSYRGYIDLASSPREISLRATISIATELSGDRMYFAAAFGRQE
jgi:hypothetical protein